jgi:DNA-directed RNA polymerase subunit RPC12/RpoP
MSPKDVQIFLAFSKNDKETMKRFAAATAKEAVTICKQEFEAQKAAPAWKTVRDDLAASKALFLLVGPKLVEAKGKGGAEWAQIQRWMGYQLGLAVALKLDVWVICDNDVTINFPVPYLNNYSLGIETKPNGYEAKVLRSYGEGSKFEFGYSKSRRYFCSNKMCGAEFNLHNVLQKGETIVCPSCLKVQRFPNGWQLQL